MSAATQTKTGKARANGKPSGLAAKLLEASLAVDNVEKKGKNTAQKYDYVRAEDIAAAATKALLAAGLVMEFEAVDSSETQIKSAKGSDGLIVKAMCRLIVTDPESGDSVTRSAIGYGSDYPGDKAIYKAMTGARKYALIHLLGIPIGDDPDEERKPPGGAAEKAPGKVGAGIAKKIVDRAWDIEPAKKQLQLAASHVAEKDVGDCSTKAKAIKALGALTFDQAQRVDEWVSKKADEEAPDG